MHKWNGPVWAVALLLLLFARLLLGAQQLSLTADEPAHIAGGYALWARGAEAFSLLSQRGYPPLACALEALSFYLAHPTLPLEQLEGWPTDYDAFARSFLPWMAPLERTAFQARLPSIGATMILAAVVLGWCKALWGSSAGLLALGVLAFDPTLLAHGRLATTDATVVALGTAALYVVWRLIERPRWLWAAGAGLLLGLTTLTKVSGPLWTAGSGLMALASAVWRRRQGRYARLLPCALLALALSLLVIWAGYAFTSGPVRGLPFSVPAPSLVEGALYLLQYKSPTFAFGQFRVGGWWWYYPLAFLVKNPLALLIAWIASLAILLRHPQSRSRLLDLALFPTLYTGIAFVAGSSIGYRHMLPIHPFLYMTIGGGLAQLGRCAPAKPRWKWFLGALGIWYVVASARIYPYEIAFFNALVGGPNNGYRYLVDSNLAWGQAAHAKADYVRTHPGVLTEPPAARFRPAPGRYLIDASQLQGVGIDDPYAYAWFRHREPSAILNYSLLVFDVSPFDIGWIGECSVPREPLEQPAVVQGMGREDLRLVTFDCTQSWLYLGGGKERGIYALHHDIVERSGWPGRQVIVPSEPFVARHLAQARVSFEQEYGNLGVPFVLYEMAPIELSGHSTVYAIPGGRPPSALQASQALDSPVALDGPLVFLKAMVYPAGDRLDIDTWWQVTDGPIPRPFAVMGHLLSADGALVGQADGLGISPLALFPGDVLVQHHHFSGLPEGPLWLLTGAYWQDTIERWGVVDRPSVDALLISVRAKATR